MTRHLLTLGTAVLLARLALSAPPAELQPPELPAKPAPEVRVDRYGDPLPKGAIARMGSLRLRHAANGILAMPDGKSVVTIGRELRFWDVATGRMTRSIDLEAVNGFFPSSCFARTGDGKRLVTGHMDNRLRLWDVESGKELWSATVTVPEPPRGRRLVYSGRVMAVALSADGKTLVSSSGETDNHLRLWDSVTGKETRQLKPPDNYSVQSFAMSDNGKTVAALVASNDPQANEGAIRLVLWDVAEGTLLRPGVKLEGTYRAVTVAPDGRSFALAEEDAIVARSVADGQETWRTKIEAEAPAPGWVPTQLTFAPDGKTLYVNGVGGTEAGVLISYDAATGAEKRTWTMAQPATQFCVFPDSATLAAVCNSAIRLWETESGKELLAHLDHPQNVGAVGISGDGKTVISCGQGELFARTWDLSTGREKRRFGGLEGGSDEVSILPNGKIVAVSDHGGTVRMYDAETGDSLGTVTGGGMTLLRQLPDGFAMGPFMGDGPGGVRVWKAADGSTTTGSASAPFGFLGLLSSTDGHLFGVEYGGRNNNGMPGRGRSADHGFRVWDAAEGRPSRYFHGHTASLLTAVISGDGRTLATRANDNSIRIWEMATVSERRKIDHENHSLTCTQNLALSSDGRFVAAPDQVGNTVCCWDVASGRKIAEFAGHTQALIAMEFTPDGRRLVSGAYDGTLLVWDVEAAATTAGVARPKRGLNDGTLKNLWDDLSGPNAAKAYRAYWDLQDAPQQALTLFRNGLRPTSPPDAIQVAQWLRELDDAKYAVRERAERELSAVVQYIEGDLRATLEKTKSAEVRQRTSRLLESASNLAGSPGLLRELRCVEILEAMRTPEARALLADLARDQGENYVGRQAKFALRRLALAVQ